MKASELILQLQKAIEKHGDIEVVQQGCYLYKPAIFLHYQEEEEKNPKYKTFAQPANTLCLL